MTREELIRNLKYTMKKHKNDIVNTFDTNISVMCKDILDYLEQEPCTDAISREKAKQFLYERLDRLNNDELYDIFSRIIDDMYNELPSVNLQPCNDAISRDAVNTLVDELARAISDERCCVSRGRSTATIMRDIYHLPSVTQKSGKWDRLYSWLNDMRLGVAPDETVTDIDERHCRESQTDILDEIMEWMVKAEREGKE